MCKYMCKKKTVDNILLMKLREFSPNASVEKETIQMKCLYIYQDKFYSSFDETIQLSYI